MPNSASINYLVGTARSRMGLQNSPTFDDQAELIPWCRDSLKQMHELLTQAWRDWYTVKRPLSLSQGRERYALPSDFRAMTAVYMIYNNGPTAYGPYREELREMSRQQWGKFTPINTIRNWPMMFRIEGPYIYFSPVATVDYRNCIELEYVPQYNGPLTDWSPIETTLPNGWEEWILLDLCLKMQVKMNLDTSDVKAQKQEVMARILMGANYRSSDPPKKKDIFQTGSGSWFMGTPGGANTWSM